MRQGREGLEYIYMEVIGLEEGGRYKGVDASHLHDHFSIHVIDLGESFSVCTYWC